MHKYSNTWGRYNFFMFLNSSCLKIQKKYYIQKYYTRDIIEILLQFKITVFQDISNPEGFIWIRNVCNIINVFTVTFDHFHASLLNKSIHLLNSLTDSKDSNNSEALIILLAPTVLYNNHIKPVFRE